MCTSVATSANTAVSVAEVTLAKFPGVSMSNTMIGRSFSMHIVKAVRSITFRRLAITSAKVISLYFVAAESFSGSAV